MVYVTGSLTSANPGADLYAVMATSLSSAGFTLVDTNVISTRTHKIWKSAAANNTQGLDWYLDVCYSTSGAGSMWLFPMEYFDPATDLAYRMAFSSSSATIEQTYYSRYGATGYTLENGNWYAYAGIATSLQLQTTTSTMGYWISITGNRIVAMTSAAPTVVTYSGLFTPTAQHAAAAGASLYPLVYTTMMGSSIASGSTTPTSVTAALTRFPKAPSLSGSGWGTLPEISSAYPTTSLPELPNALLAVAGAFQVSPMLLYTRNNLTSGPLGTLDGMGYATSSGVARGDTLTISGQTWVLASTSSSGSLAFKAA